MRVLIRIAPYLTAAQLSWLVKDRRLDRGMKKQQNSAGAAAAAVGVGSASEGQKRDF